MRFMVSKIANYDSISKQNAPKSSFKTHEIEILRRAQMIVTRYRKIRHEWDKSQDGLPFLVPITILA